MATKDGNETNDLSWTWAVAGTALFGVAIAAPMMVLNLSQSLRDAPQPTEPAKVEIADSSERDTEDTNKTEQPLETALLTATIAPGVGMGKVSLGQPIASVLDDLAERFQPHFSTDQEGSVQHHSFFLREVEVRLDSRPEDGRIEAIRLSAKSCADLEQSQPREEGLPETADGLTIGSHQSRVIRRMGIPVKGQPIAPIPGPMRQPAKQVYDGITFEYCQDTMLVRAVEINRSNGLRHDVDLLATTSHPSARASEPTQLLALTDTRTESGLSTVVADLPETTPPDAPEMPGLDKGVVDVSMPPRPTVVSVPGDLAPQIAGVDAIGALALTPVVDQLPRPDQSGVLLAELVEHEDSFPIRKVSTKSLPVPQTVGQVASLTPPRESQTRYVTATSSLALLPTYSGVVDRGLFSLTAETGPPVLARAPDRPTGQAVPGKTNGQPSALAALDQSQDQSSPLAQVKPGASLPLLRAQPQASLPAASATDIHRPVYQSTDQVQLAVATVDRLIAPVFAPTAVDLPPGPPEMAPEWAEESLQLSRDTRRKLQRRLSLIGYDPAGIDGIFGPKTRVAIAALQQDADLEPTGFIDAQVKELIEARSQKSFAQWRKAQRKRRALSRRLAPTASAPVTVAKIPQAKRIPKCQRGEDGLIASNQSFSCDVDLLQESLQALFNFQS
ncbi:MAG: peptidoglycan-binding domain-containing protein [Pseudomonadota bacterium]